MANCFTAAGLAAGMAALVLSVVPAFADPISKLPGRWAGWGAVTLSGGKTERVKCVATYFLKKGGADIKQNLRCASATYKINTVANYKVKGKKVSGTWEERTHSNTGNISGSVTAKGFNLSVAAETFSAKITITTGKCKQSISLVPTNLDVTRIAIGLRKC